jgi:YD repeat-containing protein
LPTTVDQLQSVVLPNGTAWTFEYTTDGFGNLARITRPTGATITYTWGIIPDTQAQVNSLPDFADLLPQVIATRTVSPNDGTSPAAHWSYSYNRVGTDLYNPQYHVITTVTDPAQNDTVHTFIGAGDASGNLYESLTQFYQGPSGNGQLLKTIQTDYVASTAVDTRNVLNPATSAVFPVRTTTTLDNGLQNKLEQDWDSGVLFQYFVYDSNLALHSCKETNECFGTVPYGIVLGRREYDWGQGAPGPLLRNTAITPLALNNSAYLNNNLLDLISNKTITDGAGNITASTSFGYDESALITSGISTQLDPAPPAGAARGNSTSTTELITTPPNSCNGNNASTGSITTSAIWFDTGSVAKHIDPLGNTTTFSYSPAFAGGYLTQSCNALNQCVSADYDFNLGLKTSFTDANHQTTSYQYDNMERVTTITQPAMIVNGVALEGSTTFAYTDTPGSLSVQRTRQQGGGTSITDFHFFDGLGRDKGTELLDSQGNIFTNTSYDAFGRLNTVTSPYRSTTDPTYGVTTTQYDALGRVTQVTHPDGAVLLSSYRGRATQIQDEGNGSSRVTRISQLDGLGHLGSVCEVTNASQTNQDSPGTCGLDIAGTGFLTTYQYDTLGDLIGVQQGSVSRSFVYDSASRLVSATNPESGTVCRQYDAAGNVVTRIRPAPNQGNPQVTVTASYNYDLLNRLTRISYSDSVTPTVTKHYDSSSELGIPLNNTLGRLSAEYVTSPGGQLLSGVVYSYDPLGHVTDNSQCTPQNCGAGMAFPLQYSYDLLGKPLTASSGQGATFSYGYNTAGRLATMATSWSDPNHPGVLFSGAQYNPLGALSAASLGGAISEGFGYDKRGRITSYTSSVIQPGASLLNNTDINSILAVTWDLDHRREIADVPFLRQTPLFRSTRRRPPASEILISDSNPSGKSDSGSIRATITPVSFDSSRRSLSIKVSYRRGQDALAVARKLATKINTSKNSPVSASVKQHGLVTIVSLTGRVATPASFLVNASVVSNRATSSIIVTTSPPGQRTRFLLGQALFSLERSGIVAESVNANRASMGVAEGGLR